MTGERRKKIASIANKMKKTKHTTVDLVLASTFAHLCRDRKKFLKLRSPLKELKDFLEQRKILKIVVIEGLQVKIHLVMPKHYNRNI
jgi:hypothetical protein